MRFRHRLEDRLLVEWLDRTQINDLGGNIFLFQLSRDHERNGNSLRIANQSYIAAFALHVCLSQRDEQLLIGRLNHSLRAVKEFRFKDQHRVIVAYGSFQQTFSVAWRRGRANFQTGHTGVKVFGGMRMRGSKLMRRTIRTPKCNRDIELPARHHEHVRRVIDDLIERYERETKRHELNDRSQADHCRADTKTGKSVLADGRVDDAFRPEALKQP